MAVIFIVVRFGETLRFRRRSEWPTARVLLVCLWLRASGVMLRVLLQARFRLCDSDHLQVIDSLCRFH